MAGAGAKLFTSGSVLTADQVNTYLMDQAIMKFASTTARDAAFGGAGEPTLAEGMFAYTTDTNTLWLYNGSSWVNLLGSDIGEQALSNRNVIINGAMQVAQRGTSTASITASAYYTADRFATTNTTLGTWTQSVEADAPTGSGFRNSLKMLCTTADASPAAADGLRIDQMFEGQNVQQFLKGTSSAKQFSVSFWVKSNVTGTYIVWLFDEDNTRHVAASYSVSASATWEKKTITFPADTTGAFNNDNARSLYLSFWLGAGSNFTSGTLATTWASYTAANAAVGQTNLAAATSNYWQITGVQLEAGAVATPFEFEQISDTLEKCQRYYETSYFFEGGIFPVTDQSSVSVFDAGNFFSSDSELGFTITWKTRKRTKPSIALYSPLTNPSTSRVRRAINGVVYSATVGGSGQDNAACGVTAGVGSVGYSCGWVASCEL
jgi:phage gp37-like protein